jgi:hypothetical protein
MESKPLFHKRKRKVYLAYDHLRDGARFDEFQRLFASLYEISRDNSMDRELDTDDAEGYIRYLREVAMAEAGSILVLCGATTHLDKFVDWEIKAALDRGGGLVGIILPENRDVTGPAREAATESGDVLPERLRKNFDGGYAVVCRWEDLARDRIELTPRLDYAMERPMDLIDNSLPLRAQTGK